MPKVVRMLLGLVILAAGCGGREADRPEGTETGAADTVAAPATPAEFGVSSVMIGKRIGENNLITEPTFQFAPQDTVYISVATSGATDSASLAAVWHFQNGKMIDSTARTITPQGPENTEFHVVSPAKGWQVGTYKVTVYVDGDSADTRTFAVRRQ